MTEYTVLRERQPGYFEAITHRIRFESPLAALHYVLGTTPPGAAVEHYLVIPDDMDRIEHASLWTVERGKPEITTSYYVEPRYGERRFLPDDEPADQESPYAGQVFTRDEVECR